MLWEFLLLWSRNPMLVRGRWILTTNTITLKAASSEIEQKAKQVCSRAWRLSS
jgi:hypothetical protein